MKFEVLSSIHCITNIDNPIGVLVVAASEQEWPKELARQMQAICDAVQQAGVPINAKQVAAYYQRTWPTKCSRYWTH